ncbi:zona pellucida-binding protein 2 [Pelodytes ibericus]
MATACAIESEIHTQTTEMDQPPLVPKHFIYGKSNHKVKVYVKVQRDSPFLVCMDEDMAHKETIDPYYLWIGPDGRNLKGHSNVKSTETGKLMLKYFEKSMSGSYSCTLSYSSVKNSINNEEEKFKMYDFIVLAYREPDYTYQINVRYTARPCEDLANTNFFEALISIVTDIITGLTCQLVDVYHKCHVIKDPEDGLQNKLFISFKVSPFGHGWERICSEIPYDCEDETNWRVQKARDIIEEFFIKQPNVLKEDFENVPEITYIEHSMKIIRIDSCRPGYGKNEITHNDCSGCCVVCDPGTFNSKSNDHCEVCTDIRIKSYGATAC